MVLSFRPADALTHSNCVLLPNLDPAVRNK
jgi:hypothetical protein